MVDNDESVAVTSDLTISQSCRSAVVLGQPLPPLQQYFRRRKSLCGVDEEESNDEEYNSKYDSSTEIYPDNLTKGAIIILDKNDNNILNGEKCNR
ncbi:hypothetical protein TNCV_3206661 [Trichonephila clavipes]|nr:hypothetical protein TNCV_3206661 [Trichonephila clavipes]